MHTCTGEGGAGAEAAEGLAEPAAGGGAEDEHPVRASAARRVWAAYRAVRGMVPMGGR